MSTKKSILLVLIVFAAVIFNACSSVPSKSSENDNQTEYIHGNTIVLEGNPTTGYTWTYSVSKKNVVSIDERVTYLGDKNIVGAPSRFEYAITGKTDGKTVITFIYSRPWESSDPLEKLVFEVIVKDSVVEIKQK